jgi:hypothetical protein
MRAASTFFSPPPCGEGPGVGVVQWGTMVQQPHDPPPRPSPARGEGEVRAGRPRSQDVRSTGEAP